MLLLAISAIIKRLKPEVIGRRSFKWAVGIMFGLCIFVVFVARVFLLVESFLSLRFLNDDVFQGIQWAHTWPSVG